VIEAPAAASEPTVARSQYLQALRDTHQLREELKRLQAEAYAEKARANAGSAQADEVRDQLVRLQAEFQNYRRRVEKEKEEALRYANADLMRALLPALDNFDRAMKTPAGDGASEFYKGIELIQKQLMDALLGFSLKPVEALGQPFDPNLHEAVSRAPSAAHAADVVLVEHAKGYWYKDRLLRPALVTVSSGPPEGAPAPGPAGEGSGDAVGAGGGSGDEAAGGDEVTA
jgi:molecular chaperone GrpE